MKELYTKLSNKYSDMSFELDNNLIVSEYKNGILVLKNVSDSKYYGVTIQYRTYYKNNIDESEVLKCLNEINSELDLRTVAACAGHSCTSTTTNIYSRFIKSSD